MEQIKGGFKKISLEINVFVDIKNTMDGWYSRLEEKRIRELEYSFEEITSNCKKNAVHRYKKKGNIRSLKTVNIQHAFNRENVNLEASDVHRKIG